MLQNSGEAALDEDHLDYVLIKCTVSLRNVLRQSWDDFCSLSFTRSSADCLDTSKMKLDFYLLFFREIQNALKKIKLKICDLIGKEVHWNKNQKKNTKLHIYIFFFRNMYKFGNLDERWIRKKMSNLKIWFRLCKVS